MDQKPGYTKLDYAKLAEAFEVIADVFRERGDAHKAAYYAAEADYNYHIFEKLNK